ncbi:barstar family protein [Olsenella massiliensis]|uniref:barstar family protein n=1 Tax=Olsenella massiliensis TaxID=1622075 RepID=UPI00071DA09A|nr:barstar family protein [Olsenella massiliensis]
MTRRQRLVIDERDVSDAASLHAYLARRLGFPIYYGANLSALADCLGDVVTPTHIIVLRRRPPASEPRWLDDVCRVLLRAARDNAALAVTVVGDEDSDPTLP